MTKSLPVVETSRCTGHCCREFPLPASPEELRAGYVKGSIPPISFYEGAVIAEMVVYLGFRKWQSKTIDKELKDQPAMHFYTCRYVQENGDCGNYENRPRMCREYPGYTRGAKCGHTECTRQTQSET